LKQKQKAELIMMSKTNSGNLYKNYNWKSFETKTTKNNLEYCIDKMTFRKNSAL